MIVTLLPAPASVLLRVLAPFAFGYMLSYLLRAVNAVAGPVIAGEFGLTAGEMGLLTAAYLGAFALFQLPIGVLLDRYGPRRVQIMLLSLAALGCLGFAAAPGFGSLFAARALIGFGFAAGLMASFKAVVMWVDLDRRPYANACIMACGGFGILLASEPASMLLTPLGWRGIFLLFGAITLAAALLIGLVVPERQQPGRPDRLGTQYGQMLTILKSAPFWRSVPMLGLGAGIHIAVLTLWSGPWLRDVMEFDRETVARQLMWMACAFIVGVFGSGLLADRLARHGVKPMQVLVGCQVFYLLAQAVLVFQWRPGAMVAWWLVAALGQTVTLGFPWFQSYFARELAGRANAALNFAMFAVAFFAQFGIGLVIDIYPATSAGYAPEGYRSAFAICLALQVVAFLWYLLAPIGRDRK